MLERALALHQKGQLAEAAVIYCEILAKDPKNVNALHLLGVLEAQRNNFLEAIALIDRAIKVAPHDATLFSNRGNALGALRRLDEALESYDHALAINPDYADALNNRGNILQDLKRFAEALASYDHALAIKPDYHEALNNRSIALYELKRFDQALESCDRALAIKPDYVDALNNRGIALYELKRFDDALASYDRALALKAGYHEALNNRGNVLRELKRFDHALASYDRALALKADYHEALNNRGIALYELRRFDDALASYDRALALRSDYQEALNNRGIALYELKRFDDALASYDRALALKSDHHEALSNRGNVLRELKRFAEALASYDRALALKPDHHGALNNRGITLYELNRFDEAIESCDRALAIKPDYAEALNTRGIALYELKRFDDALASYDRALSTKPDYAEASHNKSFVLLASGDFRRGWKNYESRWQTEEQRLNPRVFLQPRPTPGTTARSLFIWAEQGVGDEIFFASLLDDAKKISLNITVEIDKRLLPLFKRSIPGVEFVETRTEAPEHIYDAQIPLGSLGMYLRNSLDDFPAHRRSFLIADAHRSSQIRQKLIPEGGFLVGISWKSKNEKTGPNRSVSLKGLSDAIFGDKIKYVSLQYGDVSAEITELTEQTGRIISQFDEVDNFNDLDGLAALIAACDLIISIDNSTAHLAGALGKDVWLILPWASGWRWLLDRDDSPWYPTMRLFRQQSAGNWKSVFSAIAQEFGSLLGGASRCLEPTRPDMASETLHVDGTPVRC